MPKEIRQPLIELLREYINLFAFEHSDMLDIDPTVMERYLNVDPTCKPLTRKKRHMGTGCYVDLEHDVGKKG